MRPIARVAAGLMLLTVGVCSAARPASPMGPRPAARPPAASPSRAALSRPAAAARSPIVARGTAPVGSGTSPIRRTASDDHDPAFPDFASLRPFSAQTQYMSRLGYVRY